MAAHSLHVEATWPNPHTRRSRRFLPSSRCLLTSAHPDLALTRGKHHTPRSRACFTALHPHIPHAHTRRVSFARESRFLSRSLAQQRGKSRAIRVAPRGTSTRVSPAQILSLAGYGTTRSRISNNETPLNLPELPKRFTQQTPQHFHPTPRRKLRLFTRSDRTEFCTYTRARHCINTNTFCIAAIFENTLSVSIHFATAVCANTRRHCGPIVRLF